MKILSFESIIKVASFRNKYDLLSNNVSRDVFDLIKDKVENKLNYRDSFYKNEYNIDLYLSFSNIDKVIDVRAKFYYPDEKNDPYIDVRILLGSSFSEKDFERLYWNIYEAIRHEYEHFDKYTKGFWPDEEYSKIISGLKNSGLLDGDFVSLTSKYMLHTIEIDSYARSIVYVAKKRKVPYGHVIDDVLSRVLFENNIDVKNRMTRDKELGQKIDNIKNKLVERIHKIFPKITLEDSF